MEVKDAAQTAETSGANLKSCVMQVKELKKVWHPELGVGHIFPRIRHKSAVWIVSSAQLISSVKVNSTAWCQAVIITYIPGLHDLSDV